MVENDFITQVDHLKTTVIDENLLSDHLDSSRDSKDNASSDCSDSSDYITSSDSSEYDDSSDEEFYARTKQKKSRKRKIKRKGKKKNQEKYQETLVSHCTFLSQNITFEIP